MEDKFYDDDEKREMTMSVDQGGVLLELPEYISSFLAITGKRGSIMAGLAVSGSGVT